MKLSLTTPRGAVVDTEVEEVTAPGALGEFGVLPGHVPLMSALKPGVLIYRTREHVGVVAVGAGFLQVAPVADGGPGGTGGTEKGGLVRDRVLVLVDEALPAGDVDRAAAESELSAADKELAAWKRDLDGSYEALLVRRQWAQARLDATTRH